MLRIGGLAIGGLTLADVLRPRAAVRVGRLSKTVGSSRCTAGEDFSRKYFARDTASTPGTSWTDGLLYRHLGIDPAATIPDFSKRPMHLLDDREVVRELLVASLVSRGSNPQALGLGYRVSALRG